MCMPGLSFYRRLTSFHFSTQDHCVWGSRGGGVFNNCWRWRPLGVIKSSTVFRSWILSYASDALFAASLWKDNAWHSRVADRRRYRTTWWTGELATAPFSRTTAVTFKNITWATRYLDHWTWDLCIPTVCHPINPICRDKSVHVTIFKNFVEQFALCEILGKYQRITQKLSIHVRLGHIMKGWECRRIRSSSVFCRMYARSGPIHSQWALFNTALLSSLSIF